jgi:hypothetical protein
MLSRADRERLAKLLAMFSSTFDGEVLNAALSAERLVKQRGLSWQDVLLGDTNAPGSDPRPSYRAPSHRAEIDACLEKANLLTEWERRFLADIGLRYSLSEKQRMVLERIKEKLASYKDMNW